MRSRFALTSLATRPSCESIPRPCRYGSRMSDSRPSRLFGTDGVRGTAGTYPLDPPTVRRLGAALVRALPASRVTPRLLVGRDTRESGVWIESELAHGASGESAVVT